MVVAENHPLADHVLHIQMIRHGAHHVRPEPFALQQRQLDQFAAGDVVDAEDHRLAVVLLVGRRLPSTGVDCGDVVGLFDFQFQLLLLGQHRVEHLIADRALTVRTTVDQQLPRLFAGIDVEQLQRDLVDLGDTQLLQQLLALRRLVEPGLELVAGLDLRFLENLFQARQIEYTQGHAGAFENILITPATFMQLALTAAHVQQRDHRQQREGQTEQAFADKRREQFFEHALTVEQTAQLPVAAAQRHSQHGVGQIVRGKHAGLGRGQALYRD